MSPTGFGMLIGAIGLLLLVRGTVTQMLIFVLFCSLFNGSSAIDVPALGWTTIQPPFFALMFLCARLCIPGSTQFDALGMAASRHVLFVVFCIYTAATAFIFPTLFEGKINIAPMRALVFSRNIFETVPLKPSSQNITTAVYILGSMAAALTTTVVARQRRSTNVLILSLGLLTWLQVSVGWLGVFLNKIHKQGVLDFFRNASYAQLEQKYAGFIRMSGVSPEASTYAAYGFVLLVFMTELWVRNVRPKLTGWAALGMFVTLVFSTSTTAYFSIAIYLPLMVVRAIMFPGSLSLKKTLTVAAGGLIMITLGLGLFVLKPVFAENMTDMVKHMTVEKPDSISGQQRTFWAKQGFEAFRISSGFGIGAGSFRSSSLATAILGSTGFLGASLFLFYLFYILKPFRQTTYYSGKNLEQNAGAAASWAALIGMMPNMISSPTPDPGLFFAVLCGLAVGWRDTGREASLVKPARRVMAAPPQGAVPA